MSLFFYFHLFLEIYRSAVSFFIFFFTRFQKRFHFFSPSSSIFFLLFFFFFEKREPTSSPPYPSPDPLLLVSLLQSMYTHEKNMGKSIRVLLLTSVCPIRSDSNRGPPPTNDHCCSVRCARDRLAAELTPGATRLAASSFITIFFYLHACERQAEVISICECRSCKCEISMGETSEEKKRRVERKDCECELIRGSPSNVMC